MEDAQKLELLRSQLDAADAAASDGSIFTAWRERTSSVMRLTMGEDHTLTSRFEVINYTPMVLALGGDNSRAIDATRRAGVSRAKALLEAAMFEVQASDRGEEDLAEAFDVELWSKIDHLVTGERWDQVVSQSVIFFEHWVRTRAELPNSLIGVELMTAAFKAGAPLALANGEVASETEGWHLLALGLTKAVRNVAGHRIEDRVDARTYAMGVLGTVSLLMTQVRLEYPA